MQLFGIFFFALTIPISAVLAERGRRRVMLWVTVAIGIFGLVLAPMFVAGTTGALLMMAVGLALMGLTYGPLGTVISELFPTSGALHRQLAGLQLRRHPGRLAGAVHRHLAGQNLWAAIRRLLSLRIGGADSPGAAFDPRDQRRRSALQYAFAT